MTARFHVVRSATSRQPARDRQPGQGRGRAGPTCVAIADRLAEAAAILHNERWGRFYGGLGTLVGAASTKPIEKRIGLLVVCVALVLVNVPPAGVRWGLDLVTDAADQPIRLVMTRNDPEEARHAVPVRLDDRSLRVGSQPALSLAAPRAGLKAIRAFAAEAAAFFGAPVRTPEFS